MQLKERYASDKLRLACIDMEKVEAILCGLSIPYSVSADCILLNLDKTLDALPILEKCKSYLSGFEVTSGTMDDAFIAITGKEIRA